MYSFRYANLKNPNARSEWMRNKSPNYESREFSREPSVSKERQLNTRTQM